jgi:hypothetical protein
MRQRWTAMAQSDKRDTPNDAPSPFHRPGHQCWKRDGSFPPRQRRHPHACRGCRGHRWPCWCSGDDRHRFVRSRPWIAETAGTPPAPPPPVHAPARPRLRGVRYTQWFARMCVEHQPCAANQPNFPYFTMGKGHSVTISDYNLSLKWLVLRSAHPGRAFLV